MNYCEIGPVLIDVQALSLSSEEIEKLQHPNCGAVILFSRNFENVAQLIDLVQQIKQARPNILIAVDQEGGRVQRFQAEFSRLPAAASLAGSLEVAQSAGWLMAAEILATGVDFSFAPVLDVDCGISEIIADRSFSSSADKVAACAAAFRYGMKQAGMSATGKHFPGHGAVAADSHLTLPCDNRSLNEISRKDLIPFQKLIEQGLEAVMPAHVLYPDVDELPAGFSKIWLQQVLRQQLSFEGAIFSDDLSMKGAEPYGDFLQRSQLALEAGCDMVLICNEADEASYVLENLNYTMPVESRHRLEKMRGQSKLSWKALSADPQWQTVSKQITSIVSYA